MSCGLIARRIGKRVSRVDRMSRVRRLPVGLPSIEDPATPPEALRPNTAQRNCPRHFVPGATDESGLGDCHEHLGASLTDAVARDW